MTANTTDDRAEAAAIEHDIERTQDEMGETVEKLEEQLNPRDVARSVIGDGGAEVARDAIEVARQNPIPVALIAVGAIWLLATSRAPAIRRIRDRIKYQARSRFGSRSDLRPRSAEPAPIGPPPPNERFDRRPM